MSKPGTSTQAEGAEQKLDAVPGRTMGLTIMCLLIGFVAVWMSLQSASQAPGELPQQADSDTQAGFLDYLGFQPGEALMGFVLIPAGPFTMGSNPALDRLAYENERWSNSRRQGLVEIDDFYIGKYEVTVGQFRAFQQEQSASAEVLAADVQSDLPVTDITWPEALDYARWLQQKMEDSPHTPDALRSYLVAGGQLSIPSEAEWEKAARGSDGRIFPWGNTPSTQFANYASNTLLPVGSKPCADCAHGLQDMSGNVWELTRSPLQPYPYNPADDAENLSEDALWVMRGGSYADAVGNVRAAVRGGVDHSVRNSTIGFRLVITKP